MPTGYTTSLYDGKDITLAEFAMLCARAFGALIELRDEPMNTPVPDEFRPSSYHDTALVSIAAKLQAVLAWSDDEADWRAESDYRKSVETHRAAVRLQRERRSRYEAMLVQVGAWEPPTSDHEELKRFMISQLEDSIRFDCAGTTSEPVRQSGAEFKARRVETLTSSLSYYERQAREERKRAAERTGWVRALRASLGVSE